MPIRRISSSAAIDVVPTSEISIKSYLAHSHRKIVCAVPIVA
jgi:hypothetical protein